MHFTKPFSSPYPERTPPSDILPTSVLSMLRIFSSSVNFLERHYRTITCAERYFLPADEGAGSSDDDFFGDTEAQESQARSEERDLKSELLRKYGGYLSGLKQEFSKKKKKGKLPKEARQTLLDWWTLHYKWPYPTVASSPPLSLQP